MNIVTKHEVYFAESHKMNGFVNNLLLVPFKCTKIS